MTQHFGQFLTNLSSAQSLKSLPIRGFCLYDVGQSLRLAPENRMLLPIRATEPRKVNIVSISGACGYNFHESLSGIETVLGEWLLLEQRCYNFHESLSGIETGFRPLRASNKSVTISTNPYQGLKRIKNEELFLSEKLQFPRIPIRD